MQKSPENDMKDHWQSALKQHWGLEARLTRLCGERDLNLLAETPDRSRFLLKVMHPGCAPGLAEMQIAALEHLRAVAAHLPVPGVVRARSGAALISVADAGGAPRLCWMVEGLPGCTCAAFTPKTVPLARAIGRMAGALDTALGGFDHPALDRPLKWNLMRADRIADRLEVIAGRRRRRILSEILTEFSAIRPVLEALPRQALHNDLNDHNILVARGPGGHPRISGIVDFGDMCRAPRVCELAIAGAYAVLDHPAPERALAALVAGYCGETPLSAGETELILPLLRLRLAVSVVNSALAARDRPDDPYVTVSEAPAWRFLERAAP